MNEEARTSAYYAAGNRWSDFDESDEHGADGPPVGAEFSADGHDWIVVQRTLKRDHIEVYARCIGCWECKVPGARWPTAAGGDDSRDWVESCDYCGLYDDDREAGEAVAQQLGGVVGTAELMGGMSTFVVVHNLDRYGRAMQCEA